MRSARRWTLPRESLRGQESFVTLGYYAEVGPLDGRSARHLVRTVRGMVGLLRAPFTPYVWRRFAYALLAPLVGLFALGLALAGRYGASGHLQRALVRTFLQVPLEEPQPAGNGAHPFLHTVVALPLTVSTFFVSTYVLAELVRNVGTWTWHGLLSGLCFAYAGSAVVCGLVMLQSRLASKLLVTKEVRSRVFV